MKRTDFAYIFCLILISHQSVVRAQWSDVTPQISYREWTLPGPIRAFAVRADRTKSNWTLDTMIGQGTLRNGVETVPDMVARYDDSVNDKGERYEIKVAINGDYFNMKTGVPPGGQIISGWYARRFPHFGGGSGFVWTQDRRCFVGGDLVNNNKIQRVVFEDATELRIFNINEPRVEGDLALYTCHYADQTYTSNDGVEVLVQMAGPMRILPGSDDNKGRIVAVRDKAGSTPIPFDHVVLSGQGKAGQALLKHAKIGQQVQINLRLQDHGIESISLPPQDWRRAYASIGGACECVVAGVVPSEHWETKARKLAKQGKKYGAVLLAPRTAVAMNDNFIYFVVIDGRSEQSIGMTFTQVGNFCVDHLKATYAITQDGGGSSTLWVDGKIMNVPSDGKLRPVANGYMLALVHKPQRSDAFSIGDNVMTRGNIQLRLGPGTQYGVAAALSDGQKGMIAEHPLNGIRAKDNNWWYCQYKDLRGWIPQTKLTQAIATE